MSELTIWTLDWVPQGPRGFVRDLRLRWACEEADLLMADVLRVPKVRGYGDRPATEAYVSRAIARPAFKKAHADQLAHFEAADKSRAS